jgi:hypothetical protein
MNVAVRTYGATPEIVGVLDPAFHEYMHYMYLPIRMPRFKGSPLRPVRLPDRLQFARDMVWEAINREERVYGNEWDYVYLTARRGYATPGNPLNRPGWHADGFGTYDINYVWTDRFPTLFAVQEFHEVSADHRTSIGQFEQQIRPENVVTYGDGLMMRLDPFVIHAAPEIPAPGGERSFLKVSFSNNRYDLVGNSHNYLFDYDWPMHRRNAARNDPARAGRDSS